MEALDPASGLVSGWIDLSGLTPMPSQFTNAVLNGIAHDSSGDRLFVIAKQADAWRFDGPVGLLQPGGRVPWL